jgi:hypothetical protein
MKTGAKQTLLAHILPVYEKCHGKTPVYFNRHERTNILNFKIGVLGTYRNRQSICLNLLSFRK